MNLPKVILSSFNAYQFKSISQHFAKFILVLDVFKIFPSILVFLNSFQYRRNKRENNLYLFVAVLW